MISLDLDLLHGELQHWSNDAVGSYNAVAVFLFGSLIHKQGTQFNQRSDIDLVVEMPVMADAVARHRWLHSLSEHKDALEYRLMRILRRSGEEPIVSLVAVTAAELAFDIHKDGHRQFFTDNTFRNLVSGDETHGIPGAGSANTDRFTAASMAFAQKIRNEFLAASANGTPTLVEYDGADPLPKRIMRAAAMAARAKGVTTAPGAEHDVQEGLDLLTNQLYNLRNAAPIYLQVQDLLSVRRQARGKYRPVEATHQLLLGEMIYDLAGASLNPSGSDSSTQDSTGRSSSGTVITAVGAGKSPPAEGKGSGSTVLEPQIKEAPTAGRDERTALPASSSTAFFAERFASAFPGARDIEWHEDSKQISIRLLALLREPLIFVDSSPIWWWRGGNLHIERFEKLADGDYLMNSDELRISRIAAVPGRSYHRHFVYVRAEPMPPTGLYDTDADKIAARVERTGYDYEEYGLFDDQHLLTRSQYDDGSAMIGDKLVQTVGRAELRVRYLTPYNFLIAANASPINNPAFDFELENRLNSALRASEQEAVEAIRNEVEKLPFRDT